MTEISLRSYTRDIDRLIEQEKLDEAIAHCRHILQNYPKYIECYRLLGKAYLEAKRYGDAADIFQRVLSAVPDDFVSHIGMSIVREDEGNLESSIWHMERAFETNPANPALQQELKRLIGRRDGFEPHKVRLTRGALARMYAHGELYPQAIAELQSALQEETDRPDLQVLLTEMYWQTEQRTEAAEIAGKILDKLPFCLKALRITAAVLQDRGKLEDAAAYHRRLAQLDPYLAYIEMPMAESSRVEADTIVLDRLSWQPGQPLPAAEGGQADWAASLGLEEGVAGPGTGPLPSWLSDIETEEEAGEKEAVAEPEEPSALPFEGLGEPTDTETGEEGAIPNWMQEAGWSEATGEAQEGPVSFSADELDSLERGEIPTESTEETETGELAPAEIPSWLQEKAPDQAAESIEDEAELAAILGASLDEEGTTEIGEEEPEPTGAEPAEVPAWLDEGEPGATSTIMTWLGDRESEGEEPAAESADELPDWIQETTPDFEAGTDSRPETEAAEEGVPGWLSGVAQAAAEAGETEEQELEQFRQQIGPGLEDEPAPSQAGDVPDWLQAITGEEPEPPEPPEEVGFSAETAAEPTEQPMDVETGAALPDSEAPPDWLAGLAGEQDEQPAEEMADEEAWLAGLEGDQPASVGTADEAASWLEELGSDETAIAAQESEQPIPNWMNGLDEEDETAPDSDVEGLASTWLEGLSETIAETPAEPSTGDTSGETGMPDWLGEMTTPEADEATRTPAEAGKQDQFGPAEGDEEDLSWLTALESQVSGEISGEAETPPAAADLESLDEDGIFNWLDQLATQQESGGSLGEGIAAEEAEEETELSEMAPPESLEEGLEWLDRLSESRGIDADITRQPAAGTPSEEPQPIEEEPTQPTSEFAAEEFSVWEPEGLEQEEAPTPELTEPSPEAALFDAMEQEEPPVEQPASIFDEPMEDDDAREPEPEPEEPVEELYTGEEIDFELAPAPEGIFGAQSDIATEEASEPEAIAEPTPDQLRAEAAPTEEPGGPESEASAPDVDEEVPEWLKAHFDSAAMDEEPAAETEAPEPEPAPPEPEASPEPPAPLPSMQGVEVEAEPEEPQPTDEPQAEPFAGEPIPGEEPIEAPPTAQITAPETTEQVEEGITEAPAQAQEPKPAEAQPVAALEAEEGAEPHAEMVEERTDAEPAEEAPEPLDATLIAAREALAEGDQEAALANYNRLIKGKRELDLVIADLTSALEDDPDMPAVWQSLGDAYMKLGRTKQAVQAYNRGMEEAEVLDNARQALASGDMDRATTQYSMLIKKGKRVDEIIEDLENAVEGEEGAPAIWQLLGDAYMKADRLNDSIEAYRRGMESV